MRNFMRITILLALALVALMACQSTGAKSDAPMAPAEIKMVRLQVPGADCASTGAAAYEALAAIDGVSDVQIDIDKETATLKYDMGRTSIEEMDKMLKEAGYEGVTGSQELN